LSASRTAAEIVHQENDLWVYAVPQASSQARSLGGRVLRYVLCHRNRDLEVVATKAHGTDQNETLSDEAVMHDALNRAAQEEHVRADRSLRVRNTDA
jgi:hypothetical protein